MGARLFDREFCEPLALLAAGTVCAAVGPAAVAGFALFGAPAVALGAWSGAKWLDRLKRQAPDTQKAVRKIQGALVEQLRGDGTLEVIKPELRGRLDRELPNLITAHWPSPNSIAKLAGQGGSLPVAIAHHVLDEIKGSAFSDDLYEATAVRNFVKRVIEAVLIAALHDKDYFATLEPQIAIENLNLTGAIKRDMDGFVARLETLDHILGEALPEIMGSLFSLHAKTDDQTERIKRIEAAIIGDKNITAEDEDRAEQTAVDLLASDLRASQDAADILERKEGVAAATSRLKQGLDAQ